MNAPGIEIYVLLQILLEKKIIYIHMIFHLTDFNVVKRNEFSILLFLIFHGTEETSPEFSHVYSFRKKFERKAIKKLVGSLCHLFFIIADYAYVRIPYDFFFELMSIICNIRKISSTQYNLKMFCKHESMLT